MRHFICQEAEPLPILKLGDTALSTINPSELAVFKSIIENTQGDIPVIVGNEFDGKPIIFDLTRAPHALIAGNDNQIHNVKQAVIRSFILKEPEAIIVDLSKREERHANLKEPLQDMSNRLNLLISEMTARYRLLSDSRMSHLGEYNRNHKGEDKLPFIVVLLKWPDEVDPEDSLYCALCEKIKLLIIKSRAAGMHWIVMSHAPNSMPSVILANLSGRLVFKHEEFDYPALLGCTNRMLDGEDEFLLRFPSTQTLIKGKSRFIQAITEWRGPGAPPGLLELIYGNGRADYIVDSSRKKRPIPGIDIDRCKAE